VQYCVRINLAQRLGPPLYAPSKISWLGRIVLLSARVRMELQETSVDLYPISIRRVAVGKILGGVNYPLQRNVGQP
jgi:hypothetical protein